MADAEFENTKEEDEDEDGEKEEEEQCEDDKKQIACFDDDRKYINASTIPVEVRLTVRRDTSIDVLRKKLPIPKAALPVTSLPAWHLMPLDQKIPNILAPTGAMVLARGTLGEKLHVTKQEYSVYDLCHQERVIIEPYDSLHDPHAKGYLNKPSVRKILVKQGLITGEGKVVCSLKQFNKYRNYLRTVYNQSLEKYIGQNYMQFKQDHETVKKIEKYDSDTSAHGHNFIKFQRRQKALQLLQKKREQFLKSYKAKQEAAQHRQRCNLQEKLRARMNRCLLAEEKKRKVSERVCRTMNNRIMRTQRLKMAVVAKDEAVRIRLENDRKYVLNSYQHFVTDWLVAKWDFQEQRLDRDKILKDSIERDLGEKSRRRLCRVARYRQVMLLIQEQKRAAEARLWAIVRKYFIIWRDKVRARKADLPDEKHQSLWDIHAALETTTKYLHEKSGLGKFDDLMTEIMRLKSSIKAQLEKEDAMHAAMLASVGVSEIKDEDNNEDGDDTAETTTTVKQPEQPQQQQQAPNTQAKPLPSSTETHLTSSKLLDVKPKSSAYASKKRSRYVSKATSRLEIKSTNSRRVTRITSKMSSRSMKKSGSSSHILKKTPSENSKTKTPSTPPSSSATQVPSTQPQHEESIPLHPSSSKDHPK